MHSLVVIVVEETRDYSLVLYSVSWGRSIQSPIIALTDGRSHSRRVFPPSGGKRRLLLCCLIYKLICYFYCCLLLSIISWKESKNLHGNFTINWKHCSSPWTATAHCCIGEPPWNYRNDLTMNFFGEKYSTDTRVLHEQRCILRSDHVSVLSSSV